jgi:hypothetical protein
LRPRHGKSGRDHAGISEPLNGFPEHLRAHTLLLRDTNGCEQYLQPASHGCEPHLGPASCGRGLYLQPASKMRRSTRWLPLCVLGIALVSGLTIGCDAPTKPGSANEAKTPSQSAEPRLPPEVAAAAKAALGPGALVVSYGDLAQNGRRQVLAANRSGSTSNLQGNIQFTRAAVLEQVGTKWVEVLRCDEYLKNPSGYLVGAPREPVTSWQLEFGGNSRDHRHDLLFTPLDTSGAASRPMSTVSVRWNPSANRYQSLDPQSGHFLEELPALEIPVAPLR